MQAETLSGGPTAAVLVHPGDRERVPTSRQRSSQAQAITAAMASLIGWLASVIERQADHQGLDPALAQKGQQPLAIHLGTGPLQRRQGGDAQPERITASQADAAASDVEGEGRTGSRCRHSAQEHSTHGRGQWLASGLELLQHRPESRHAEAGRAGSLATPDTAGHQHLLLLGIGTQAAQPLLPGTVANLAGEPER